MQWEGSIFICVYIFHLGCGRKTNSEILDQRGLYVGTLLRQVKDGHGWGCCFTFTTQPEIQLPLLCEIKCLGGEGCTSEVLMIGNSIARATLTRGTFSLDSS